MPCNGKFLMPVCLIFNIFRGPKLIRTWVPCICLIAAMYSVAPADDQSSIVKRYIEVSIRIRDRELETLANDLRSARQEASQRRMSSSEKKAHKAKIVEMEYQLKHPDEFFPAPRLDLMSLSVGDMGRIADRYSTVVKEASDGAFIQESHGGTITKTITGQVLSAEPEVNGPVIFVKDNRYAKLHKDDRIEPDETVFVVVSRRGVLSLEPIDMSPVKEEVERLRKEARAEREKDKKAKRGAGR